MPKLKYFDFFRSLLESYVKEFSKWKFLPDRESRKARLLRDLCSIIQQHVSRKFGSSVIIEDLHGAFTEDFRRKFLFNAYPLAGRTAAGKVRMWAKQQAGMHNIEYVFESGDDNYGQLIERMRKDKFPDPIFRPGKLSKSCPERVPFIRLQASDLFAHYLFRPLKGIAQTGKCDDIPEVVSILDKCPQGEPGILLAHNLNEMEQTLSVPSLEFEESISALEKKVLWS